jgi:hypothetical protein
MAARNRNFGTTKILSLIDDSVLERLFDADLESTC